MSARKPSAVIALIALPAPILYGLIFLAGIFIEHGWIGPMAWPSGVRPLGGILLAAGILLAPASALLFGIRRTTLNPIGQPARLVTTGAFRVTRNPMYLGVTLAYVGLSLVFRRIVPLALLPFAVLLINYIVIPYEEARLRERFGDAYVEYCCRVRRWL